jgi:hypothetical protein
LVRPSTTKQTNNGKKAGKPAPEPQRSANVWIEKEAALSNRLSYE